MENKRILNYRPLVLIFITVVCGIFIAYAYFNALVKHTFNFAILIYLFLVLLVVASITYFFFMKNKICTKAILNKILLFIISFILSTIASFICFNAYLNLNNFQNENIDITGKVSKIINSTYFELTDCEVMYQNKIISVKVPVVVYNASSLNDIDLGDRLEFAGELKYSHSDTLNYSLLDVINESEFSITINDDSIIEYNKAGYNFKSKIKLRVKNLLMNIMSEENALVANGVLFGDTEEVDPSVTQMFSYAGVSHILAVSGLHIGVLVSVLAFLLKKFKANKYVAFSVVIVFLLAYSYLCDFSPSVLRASLMFAIYYGSNILGLRNDKLNSWCLAGIVLLILNPLNLFNVGYQLSFVCIFALFLLSNYVINFLIKIKFGKYVSNLLGPSIAINLLTLPIIVTIFNQVSLLGILSNIVVLPLFSIMYLMLFIFIVICCIFPFMVFILKLPEFLIHILIRFCDIINSIKFGVFHIFSSGYLCLIIAMIALWLSNYLIVKAKIKLSLCAPLILLSIILFVINALPANYYTEELNSPFMQYNSNAMVMVSNNRVVLVGSVDYQNNLKKFLNKNKINHIEDFLITDFEYNKINEYLELINYYSIENVYIPKSYANNNFFENKLENCKMNTIEDVNINNIYVNPVYSISDELIGLKIKQQNKVYLYSHQNDKNKVINFLSSVNEVVENIYLLDESFKLDDYFTFDYNKVYYIKTDKTIGVGKDYSVNNNKLMRVS